MINEPTTHVRLSTAPRRTDGQRLRAVGGPMHLNWFRLDRRHAAGETVAIGRQLYRVTPNDDGTLELVHAGDAHRVDL